MQQLDFFYFFGSGYSYLSVMRVDAVSKRSGVAVRWRPFNVRTVMAENNIALRTQAAKVKYMWRDVERRAATHGVPYVRPPIWPTDPDLVANRVAMVAAEEGWCEAYTVASFRAWYLEGMDLGSRAHLEHVLAPLGQDVGRAIARADEPGAHERLKAETDAARNYGIFGSPAFVVDGETFWGDDRLEEALAWAAGRHDLQALRHH
ncbi:MULTISPECIES: 2-hydroxychromene-2-carboxylate isomerase [unclassified Mesorhizobium]|uniref:2-hydroxychromene-2-carboxylate isomerase n=1 Tax=unclassified Mesorhizobium TaxID=325217 RepID=UPI001128FD37|nr:MULTISPECIES: 2-hydroxychromene-2-carboxylate isomerase [unclassified Mesorhizobium]TPJ39698.1 2-hydroxychromene-2-carboxylate isomerase [Mesorhizobium sp. B2-6-6]MCA0008781.1 2-hydroxychromene-2-carboxylate isomerase [Mesorhizobium sp. B264B1B]MCA0022119.1 2-hydroxychromene-2-carboxylate isomerase [Mesorhizobium sp. B264B1A]MCA0028613.1 2-hydroxychromene-2-carboxylate isomerase [Mesorhizobium sp. B263B1A]MCA0056822.1 2-hydroxychromene-2-carboxylate isomerase [Mesorhizobium sp. B261B1A]